MTPAPVSPAAVKERPILFSAPMIKAILADRKWVTRRVVKPQPEEVGFGRSCSIAPYCTGTDWPLAYYEMRGACWNSSDPLRCPYVVGGNLWVREAFGAWPGSTDAERAILYRATAPDFPGDWPRRRGPIGDYVRWRPSIFMPRWASRLTLEIVSVSVQRLAEISCSDIRSEGLACPEHDFPSGFCHGECPSLRRAFASGWDALNGKRAGASWAASPWVWCISFKRVETGR